MKEIKKQGRIIIIAPKEPVTVSRLEKDKEKLQKLYEDGKRDMEENIERIMEKLEKN